MKTALEVSAQRFSESGFDNAHSGRFEGDHVIDLDDAAPKCAVAVALDTRTITFDFNEKRNHRGRCMSG